jgi:dihydrofolate reductase
MNGWQTLILAVTLRSMTKVSCNVSISADGFVAGSDQSIDNPLGVGGIQLHEWHFEPKGAEQGIVEDWLGGSAGAYVMGRNMFSAGRGPWDLGWRGWWGEDPPYHTPVFVLTHYERASLTMDGGTSFHFITDGLDSALAQAKAAAGDKNVEIAGGAATINAYLNAGAINELYLHITPVLLTVGERLFDGVADLKLTPIEVVDSPTTTHIKYRVG